MFTVPKIVTPPKFEQVVYDKKGVGDAEGPYEVTIQCEVENDSGDSRQWDSTATASLIPYIQNDGSLKLTSIAKDDTASVSGVDYWCYASNDIGRVVSTNGTLVYATFNSGNWEKPIGVIEALDGYTAVIPCEVPDDAKPHPMVQWQVDNEDLDLTKPENVVLPSGNLQIDPVSKSMDGKEFFCTVTNQFVTYSISSPKHATLRVQGNSTDCNCKVVRTVEIYINNVTFWKVVML